MHRPVPARATDVFQAIRLTLVALRGRYRRFAESAPYRAACRAASAHRPACRSKFQPEPYWYRARGGGINGFRRGRAVPRAASRSTGVPRRSTRSSRAGRGPSAPVGGPSVGPAFGGSGALLFQGTNSTVTSRTSARPSRSITRS